MTSDILAKLNISHVHSCATLAELRILFICFVSYAGFLRFDDISNITRKDCKINTDSLTIHLVKSKSDQFRQGADVVIARTFKPTCPVLVAERYFKALGDPADSVTGGSQAHLYQERPHTVQAPTQLHPYTGDCPGRSQTHRSRCLRLRSSQPKVRRSIRGLQCPCSPVLNIKARQVENRKLSKQYFKLDKEATLITTKNLGI